MKYLLTEIDIFLRYGWIVPLKNKTGLELARTGGLAGEWITRGETRDF